MKKASKSVASRKSAKRATRGAARPEYDFAGGVRGKYVTRLAHGSNLVLLDADVASRFRSDRAVNEALRQFLGLTPK